MEVRSVDVGPSASQQASTSPCVCTRSGVHRCGSHHGERAGPAPSEHRATGSCHQRRRTNRRNVSYLPVEKINKVKEGRPHIVDAMKNGDIALVFTTVDETRDAINDSSSIRKTAIAQRITYQTTVAGAEAAVEGMKHLHEIHVYDVQGLHASLAK